MIATEGFAFPRLVWATYIGYSLIAQLLTQVMVGWSVIRLVTRFASTKRVTEALLMGATAGYLHIGLSAGLVIAAAGASNALSSIRCFGIGSERRAMAAAAPLANRSSTPRCAAPGLGSSSRRAVHGPGTCFGTTQKLTRMVPPKVTSRLKR